MLSIHTTKDLQGWSTLIRQHPWEAVIVTEPSHVQLLDACGVRSSTRMPISVIPPGIDRERFSPSAEPDAEVLAMAEDGTKIVAELGARLISDKGPDIAIRTAILLRGIFPATTALLGQRPPSDKVDVGTRKEDAMRSTIRGEAANAGFVEERDFRFVSFSPERVPGVLRAIDVSGGVLLAPSRIETFGMLPLEAMAGGVPVIASDASGHRSTMGGHMPLIPVTSERDAPRLYAEAAVPILRGGDARERAIAVGTEIVSAYGSDSTASRRVENVYEPAVDRAVRIPAPLRTVTVESGRESVAPIVQPQPVTRPDGNPFTIA